MFSHPDYRELINALHQIKNAYLPCFCCFLFVKEYIIMQQIKFETSSVLWLFLLQYIMRNTTFLYSDVICEVMWGNVTVAKPSVWVEDERLTGKVVVVCSIQIAVVKTV